MQQLMATTDATRLILLSPTGSGKTAAFAIRLLRAIGPSKGVLQAVVIAPSRELVIQIADVIRPVAAGIKTVAFYGGHNMADEVNSLKSMPDIIVTTPGRLLDHITRGNLDVAGVHALVLDEYDKSSRTRLPRRDATHRAPYEISETYYPYFGHPACRTPRFPSDAGSRDG